MRVPERLEHERQEARLHTYAKCVLSPDGRHTSGVAQSRSSLWKCGRFYRTSLPRQGFAGFDLSQLPGHLCDARLVRRRLLDQQLPPVFDSCSRAGSRLMLSGPESRVLTV